MAKLLTDNIRVGPVKTRPAGSYSLFFVEGQQ